MNKKRSRLTTQRKAAAKRRPKDADASQSVRSITERARAALREARKLKQNQVSWIDGNNKLFGPEGVLSGLFPNKRDRTAFIKTTQSNEILGILNALPEP